MKCRQILTSSECILITLPSRKLAAPCNLVLFVGVVIRQKCMEMPPWVLFTGFKRPDTTIYPGCRHRLWQIVHLMGSVMMLGPPQQWVFWAGSAVASGVLMLLALCRQMAGVLCLAAFSQEISSGRIVTHTDRTSWPVLPRPRRSHRYFLLPVGMTRLNLWILIDSRNVSEGWWSPQTAGLAL